MLTIWGRNNSVNVQKVMWMVGELGLAHQRRDVGGAFGGLDSAAYGALNPNRLIPTLEDGDTVIWESHAILRYLAVRYDAGGLWPEDPIVRAEADRWMDWMITTILPNLHPVFWGLVRTPPGERDMAVIETAAEALGQKWRILDAHLAGRPFVAGERLSMGDFPVGAACYRYHALDIVRPDMPHLRAWYDRLQSHPAYREHVMIPLS